MAGVEIYKQLLSSSDRAPDDPARAPAPSGWTPDPSPEDESEPGRSGPSSPSESPPPMPSRTPVGNDGAQILPGSGPPLNINHDVYIAPAAQTPLTPGNNDPKYGGRGTPRRRGA
jgi:hypothetical protein